MDRFTADNESTLRDIYIHNYVFNTPPNFLYSKTTVMIFSNTYTRNLCICDEFDEGKLSEIMKPYLYLSETSHYSLNPDKRYFASIELDKRLELFYKFNPFFGRKLMVFGSANAPSAVNMIHLDFYKMVIRTAEELVERELDLDETDENAGTVVMSESESESEFDGADDE